MVHYIHRTKLLLAAGVAVGSLVSTGAQAQDQAPEPSGGIEEIIVTAQRTGQNLQKVPIAISAITSSMAENMGVRASQDITIAAPAVTFSETGSGANINIRGVGASGSTVDESANALYIDGVYQAASPGLLFNLNNIERIEIAKGPQGTLFGRNSTGGVIQIITKDPSQTPHGDIAVGYGNYGTDTEKLYLTGGLANNLAGDIAVYREHQADGWGKNVFNGKDAYRGRSLAIRSKLKFTPDEDTDIIASGMYSKTHPAAGQGGSILPGERTTGNPSTDNTGFFNINYDGRFNKEVEQKQASLTVRRDLGWARLVNIAAYSETVLDLAQDRDMGPASTVQVDIHYPVKTFSEELQLLSSTSSPVTWAAGLFYFRIKTALDPLVYSGPSVTSRAFPTQQIAASAITNSYSAYAQATVPLTDQLRATLGLRYTIDDSSFSALSTSSANVTTPYSGDKVDRKLTKRVALDYQVDPNLLVYASYTTGFHSGLFNIASPSQSPVDPENVTAFEGGFKSDLLDKKVRLNVSAFRYKFKGIQVRALNNLGAAVLINAASAAIKGIDADLSIAPFTGLRLNAGLAYLDSRYGSFAGAPYFSVAAAGLTQTFQDASGNRTILSPKWVATLSADYKVGPVNLFVTNVYNSGVFFDPQNRVSSGSYNLVNAGVNYEIREGIDLRIYSKNLFDKRYYASVASSALGDQYYPGAPRTYGVELRYRF
nr:TonB-dependent receptor [Sphingomonas sp. Y57]